MTAIEIIDEVLASYIINPKTRAASDEGRCHYLDEKGRKCAVGKCLDPDKPDYHEIVKNNEPSCELDLEPHLLEKYRGHPPEFWSDLQCTHDEKLFWTETGLTDLGKRRLKLLKEKWTQ